MEKEVFDKFTKLADGKNPTQTWNTIKDTLVRFNAVHEDSAGTDISLLTQARKSTY
jgi:hypothetical protein